MSEQERSDDLLRRKLQERTFPFEEADWQAAQRLIRVERARRRLRRLRPLIIAALLITGAGMAYLTAPSETPAGGSGATVPQAHGRERQKPSAVAVPSTVATPLAEAAEGATDRTSAATLSMPTDGEADRTGGASTGPKGPERSARSTAAASRSTSPSLRTHPASQPAERLTATPARTMDGMVDGPTDEAAPTIGPPPSAETPSDAPIDAVVADRMNEEGPHADATAVPPPTEVPATDAALPATAVEEVVPPGIPVAAPHATDEHIPLIGMQPNAPAANAADSTGGGPGQATDADTAAVPGGDTAMTTPPIIRPGSPWELSVVGGPLWGRGRYGGAPHDAWGADVMCGTGWCVGAEVMHMGRHIGIGTGVHYSTYTERLVVPELTNTGMGVEHYFFLRPVDTTVTVGTGTFTVNGQTFHSIISVDTVINVLTTGYDTTTVVTVRRAAREQVNRVSYLEVPLLLDAHLRQGRWTVGLCAGPTLGILTGRRGALPGPDGYTDLNDVRFRSLVLGCTAKAYLRYRWNSAWSAGLEPVWRAQLGNGLEGELERSATAFGVMLGITYQLR